MIVDLASLSGTSAEKVGALVAQLRGNGQSNAMLWACSKVPFGIGDTVKWLVNELPTRSADDIDTMLDQVIEQVATLKSDAQEAPNGDDDGN